LVQWPRQDLIPIISRDGEDGHYSPSSSSNTAAESSTGGAYSYSPHGKWGSKSTKALLSIAGRWSHGHSPFRQWPFSPWSIGWSMQGQKLEQIDFARSRPSLQGLSLGVTLRVIQSIQRIAPTPIMFVIGLLNCVSIERRGGTSLNQRSGCVQYVPLIPAILWCPVVDRSGSSPYHRRGTATFESDLSTRHYGRTWIDHDENRLLHNVIEESQFSSTGFLPSRRRYEFHSGRRFKALPEGKREWPFLLPSVKTEIEDWAFSLVYREAAGVNSISSSSPWFEEFDYWPSLQKIAELVDSESAGLEESRATRIFNGFKSLLIPGVRPNSMEFAIRSTCPRFEEFDYWPSLQKIAELVDSESAGLEESRATRIFNGFKSLLIPGVRPNSMEFAISLVPHLNDNSKPYLNQENLDDIINYSHSLEVWNPEYSVAYVAGKEVVHERVCFGLGSAEEGESRQQWGRVTGRLQGECQDAISLEREASKACCRGDPVTFMNVEEWGIFLVTVPMFRRTNAAEEVQNRPAKDGRVRVVEPKAQEALKKGGGDGRLYFEYMPKSDSANMIIDVESLDNIASTEMVDQLELGK
nr:hypothetical protein [Tanacetum cinerariifolium]